MIWAYCRVSTTKDEQELSLETQEAWAREHSQHRDEELRVFRERASAKTTIGRPIFQAMIGELAALAAAKRPKQILVTSFDRLSRDMTDTLVVARTLRQMRVELFVRDMGGVVAAETFAQRAALVGLSMGGEAENEAKSARARASWARRAAEGKPMSNKAPYGIQLRNERDTPAPGTSDWVREAFQWYADGLGLPAIATRMKEAPPHRVKTSRVDADGKPIERVRETLWEPNRVRKMLELRRYRGTVVDNELFDRVQTLMQSKPRWRSDRKREYPLSGAMACTTCGRHLHGRTQGNATGRPRYRKRTNDWVTYTFKKIRYYGCTVCAYQVNADRTEAQFREMLGPMIADPALLTRFVAGDDATASLRDAQREIARLERALDETVLAAERDRLWAFAMNGGPAIAADLERRLTKIAERVATDRARLSALRDFAKLRDRSQRAAASTSALLSRFWDLYEVAAYEQKRELIGSICSSLGGLAVSRDGLQWIRNMEAAPPKRVRVA